MNLNKDGFLLIDSLLMLLITCLIVSMISLMIQSYRNLNYEDVFQNEKYAQILS